MPQTGIGVIPGGITGDELRNFTRRAFVGKAIVQTRKTTPLLAAIIGNAHPATGGVSSVTVPMQGGSYVQTFSTDYSGKFPQPPALNPGVNAEWNLKAIITPIPFLGMEGIIQDDAAVIPILALRMNDAGNSAAEYLSNLLWTNGTYGSQDIDGLPLIASATGTYAGLSRSTNTWLQANVIHAGNVDPTRELIMQFIVSAAKFSDGEMPDFGITGPGTWNLLSRSFLALENFMITPGASFDRSKTEGPRSGFTALMVGSVPIYYDPAFGTEGTIYLFKAKYTSAYIHRAAAFAFTGFQSTLANYQLGYVGAVVTVLEIVCVKPKSVTVIDQLNFTSV
jgi:hypothetical protein